MNKNGGAPLSGFLQGLGAVLKRASGGAATRMSDVRPEAMRRKAILDTARLVLAAGVLAMPVALYALLQSHLLPFILATVALATGAATLGLGQRGQYERAAAGQIYATMLTGALLTAADPALADFGLAVAVLGPVQAALLTRSPVRKRTWALLVAVLGIGLIGQVSPVAWPEPFGQGYALMAGLAFTMVAALVALSAHRLDGAFEVNEKAQVAAYRHLVEHAQDAVLRFGPDGAIRFVSRSAETLFGCKRYELGGNGVVERIHLLDRPAYMTAFAEANRDGRSRQVEVRMRRDEPGVSSAVPKFMWVEASLSPVEDQLEDGRFEVVVLLADVTERHDQFQQLQRARREAEEASVAKTRFLATIGHELRTPLNAIVGFSEMMTSGVVGEMSPQHREYAALIHQSGRHLLDVVQMMLDMSRIDAGRFELSTERIAADALVAPAFGMIEGMAGEKSVRLVSEMPASLPLMLADERACRQILINLLSNAVKFSRDGGTVKLSARRQGRHIAMVVSDEGIGMSAEAVARIGEPFFQAHGGLDRPHQGTGLGLSIVKGLVDLHQGSLHAASTPGEGTVMTVLLPINGPETKLEETDAVTPLHRDPAPQHMATWQDERKRAL